MAFKKFHYNDLQFEPASFQLKFSCTEKFFDWWNAYYTRLAAGVTDKDLMDNVIAAFPSENEEKKPKAAAPLKKIPTKTTARAKVKAPIVSQKKPISQPAPTPAIAKKKSKTPSPAAKAKIKGKHVVVSSSEETDSEDDVPLIQRSRKRTMVESQRASKGIIIREPQEQTQEPPTKKLKMKEAQLAVPTAVEIVNKPVASDPSSTQPIPTTPTASLTIPEVSNVGVLNEPSPEIAMQVTEAPTPMDQDEVEEAASVEAGVATSVSEFPIIHIEETVAVEENTNVPTTATVESEDSRGRAGDEAKAQEGISAKDSTSSAISEQELAEMKKKNPLAAFKLLMSLSTSSTQLVSSSSTASLNSAGQDSSEGLIRQLKAKILEGDLLAKIGENPSEIYEIKEILQKLHKLEPSTELLTFLVEFGPIFESLSLNVRQRADVIKHKEKEAALHQEQFNSFKTSQITIDTLEAQMTKDEKDLDGWNSKIQRYNEEIKILQTKLANAEFQRSLVQERMKAPASQLETEATEAIKHFDEAQKHQATITRLDKELDYLESSIAVSAKILDRLKTTLHGIQ